MAGLPEQSDRRGVEDFARSRGAVRIECSIFGFNSASRDLFDAMGFEVLSMVMGKRLDSL